MTARFITFEGGEGAGKSTQIRRLEKTLRARSIDVVVTREPGGTTGAEAVRHVLLSGAARSLGAKAEAMLFAAARIDHVDHLIRPALEAGKWVLCDRFTDSTRVYQGESGVTEPVLDLLETVATNGLRPDLTLILDVPADVGLKRAAKRMRSGTGADLDRFEKDDLAIHVRRRNAFLALAEREPERCLVVDANTTQKRTADAIWQAVETRFSTDLGGDDKDAFASIDAALAALRSAG